MTNKVSNITEVKKKKKLTALRNDIHTIIKVLELSQKSLSFFNKYTPVQRIVSIMETEKNLLFIHFKKIEKELELLKGE